MTDNNRAEFTSLTARIAALRQQGIDNNNHNHNNNIKNKNKISSLPEKRNTSTPCSKQRPSLPARPRTARDSTGFDFNNLTSTNTDNDLSNSQERPLPQAPPIEYKLSQACISKSEVIRPLTQKRQPISLSCTPSNQHTQEVLCGPDDFQNFTDSDVEIGNQWKKTPLIFQKEEQNDLLKTKKDIIIKSGDFPLDSFKYKLAQSPDSLPVNRRNIVNIQTSKPKLPPRHNKIDIGKDIAAIAESYKASSISRLKSQDFGFKNRSENRTSNQPNHLSINPPPINLSSKPSIRETQTQEIFSNGAINCLRCRDFSAPDQVASQYPRQLLPKTHDIIAYLSSVLCDPFPSATDKARAIFTWLHYNIAYDVEAFFRNQIKSSLPEDIIMSGLAVCIGYAGVFEAIAVKAGLEAISIVGHGKGFGFKPIKPGEPVPFCNPSGHAWNSVRIDNGEWKLIDSCWGAGNIDGKKFTPKFSPSLFTCSNEEFGIRHFPQEVKYFFRSDGIIPSWEQYIRGLGPTDQEPLQEYGNLEDDHGISRTSITPPQKYISPNFSEAYIRFQFRRICEHFCDNEKERLSSSLFLLCLHSSTHDEWLPFDSNRYWWWLDVPTKDLNAGQRIVCYTVNSINGTHVKSITKEEYLQKKGKCAMGFSGVCAWEVS
ncbi:Kyphoscoliosis peptidase [Erysiphe necator]|nr:Kyphoscoliosis peptidase [Erysiphe necator]